MATRSRFRLLLPFCDTTGGEVDERFALFAVTSGLRDFVPLFDASVSGKGI